MNDFFQGQEKHEHKLKVLFLTKVERDEQDFTPKSDTHNMFFFKGRRQVNDNFLLFKSNIQKNNIYFNKLKNIQHFFFQMPEVCE